MTFVSGPASLRMAASSPTAMIVLPSSATACAMGKAGFSVQTLPLTRIKLASLACATEQQRLSASKAIATNGALIKEREDFFMVRERSVSAGGATRRFLLFRVRA